MSRRLIARPVFVSVCLVVSILLVTAGPASAARIYNFLPFRVWVGGVDGNVTLRPGEKSHSLSWGMSNLVDVYAAAIANKVPLCLLGFGLHAEMTGGHYLIIGFHDRQVSCRLCDSDGKQMHSASGEVPEKYWTDVRGKSSKTGC